jgi:hypothetical protein
MADIQPYNGLQSRVASRYDGPNGCGDGGEDMDLDDRLHAAEKDILRLMGSQARHEEVCALRYEIIKKGNDQIAGYIKWLALSVGALALVVLGVATVNDLIRSGAARVGVTVQAAPQPNPYQSSPQQPYPR